MKIIVCSDNFFFAQGITSLLKAEGHDTWDFFYQPEKSLPDNQQEELVIIVDTCERKRLRQLFSKLHGRALRIFFISDELFDGNEIHRPFQGIIPRKISLEALLESLEQCEDGARPLEFLLTLQQRKVLQYLIRGVTPGVIARIMNISVKTVSAHKRKVMMNFGLKKMNARALNYLADFIYKSLLISDHIRQRKSQHFINHAVY
ncbi:helix-turn-helix transcriptional regulator [Mixta intestinalis]|jgi:DNA-binding CsgD family transcriptional regulator|uniref:HTH luxR-type domain-containing protein n=1 Tax=Mixta intestinalis TaxID=1615494 RepID=A0A6P1Q313_9GAMM|nr:LuxR C-terminal-related transcriptional regulator [Mixta intestinalis]QHM73390.1 hypothetical protein C7M51_03737 [Mixta intestinalis]